MSKGAAAPWSVPLLRETYTNNGAPILFIVGPTGVGKTRLAVALAQQFNCEIINADSRQVYRHMDIGTGKPSAEELNQATHHLLDILEPDQDFGLASFLSCARAAIGHIQSRRFLPIVAGGTGQYIWALIEGWQVPQVPPDPAFRHTKQLEAEAHGAEFVFRQLEAVDPQRAARLDPRNLRRVIRALEVHTATRSAPSSLGPETWPLENRLIIGLTMKRQRLYQRIDDRVDRMIVAGFNEEVRSLTAGGYALGKGPLSSPGYRELGQYLAGEITLDEAAQRTKFQTHRMARRQYSWFKPVDSRIRWLDAEDGDVESSAAGLVAEFLQSAPAVVE